LYFRRKRKRIEEKSGHREGDSDFNNKSNIGFLRTDVVNASTTFVI